MRRGFWLLVLVAGLMAACGDRRTSPEVLQHKIDSIRMQEQLRQLKAQGFDVEDVSPFQMFYDSLALQALPLTYSEDYVDMLPDYRLVPPSIVSFLELEGRESPRAIALPEAAGTRLVLLAADLEDGAYELWLYSLDSQYFPVDKLLLYAPAAITEYDLTLGRQLSYFSITSDYKINVMEYTDERDRLGQLSTFVVDDSLMFVEERLP